MKLKKPWEQWPDETNKAYHYFIGYLELGKNRSLDKLRRKYNKNTSYKRQLAKWSAQHDWVDRVNAYDIHMTEKALKDRSEIIDHAMGRLLMNVDKALDQLFEIMTLPNYVKLENGEKSVLSHKIKAIQMILDRVGLVAYKEPYEPKNDTSDSEYIRNIFDQMENN